MKNLAAFIASEIKRIAAEERELGLFLCRKTVRIKLVPTSILNIVGRRPFVWAKKRRQKNWSMIRAQVLKHFTSGRKKQKKCQERTDCQRSDGEEQECWGH